MWRTTYAYPLSIALICTACFMNDEILRPATHVFVMNTPQPWARVVCAAHSVQVIWEKEESRGDVMVPAREIEAELMARYGVGRTNLAVAEEDPGLFLAEMGIAGVKG